jgi:hypothetical protein
VKPRLRRELAEWAQVAHQMSQRRVAGLIPVERGTLRYQHHRDRQEALRVRLRELAGSRVRYGYPNNAAQLFHALSPKGHVAPPPGGSINTDDALGQAHNLW